MVYIIMFFSNKNDGSFDYNIFFLIFIIFFFIELNIWNIYI